MKEFHLAIIMDGNGRWAQQRGLSRSRGHQKGIENIRLIIEKASKYGIKYLTFFCFSTENWKRPKKEVDYLMKALVRFSSKHIKDFMKNDIAIRAVGFKHNLPENTAKALAELEEKTKNNKKLFVQLAIDYGGKQEIVEACKKIITKHQQGEIVLDDIDENLLASQLFTYPCPPVDLLIRTSGEKRISNFLLFQLAYSEFYFTDIYWPDFDESELVKALDDFKSRQRRFGGLTNEN